MATLGRAIIRIAPRHPVLGKPWLAAYHAIQVSKPPACLAALAAIGRSPPARGKRILTQRPAHFTGKHEQDKVDPDLELVYVNNMHNYYFFCQVSVYALLIPALGACAYLLWTHRADVRQGLERDGLDHPYAIAAPAALFAAAMLGFTNAVCRRAVIRMYHAPAAHSYVAVTQRWNMRRQTLAFTAQDCVPLSKTSIATQHLLGGNVRIKGRVFLLRDTDFRQPHYYNELMGYERAEEDRAERTVDDFRHLLKRKTKKND